MKTREDYYRQWRSKTPKLEATATDTDIAKRRCRMRMRAWRRKRASVEAKAAKAKVRAEEKAARAEALAIARAERAPVRVVALRIYRRRWAQANGEKITSRKLKRMSPEDSLFTVFTALDQCPKFQKHIMAHTLNPLEMLMLKEECFERAA